MAEELRTRPESGQCPYCVNVVSADRWESHLRTTHKMGNSGDGAAAPTPKKSTGSPTQKKSTGSTVASGILLGGYVLWSIGGFVLVAIGIIAFIWGGTNNAHEHCLAHRYGDNGFLSTISCVVEH